MAQGEEKVQVLGLVYSTRQEGWFTTTSYFPRSNGKTTGITGKPEQIGATGRWKFVFSLDDMTTEHAFSLLKDAVLEWLDEGIDEILQKKYKLLEH